MVKSKKRVGKLPIAVNDWVICGMNNWAGEVIGIDEKERRYLMVDLHGPNGQGGIIIQFHHEVQFSGEKNKVVAFAAKIDAVRKRYGKLERAAELKKQKATEDCERAIDKLFVSTRRKHGAKAAARSRA
jgi:hypothetical protein